MTYHIYPVNDLKEHDEESTCECSPEIKWQDGHMLVIHNSHDGREAIEQANKILSE